MTQSELESRIQVLLAGTVTEEMIFDDVSTGAQNDLERATEIARAMVMDYGMSSLGRVTFRESPRSHFLGGGADERQHNYSEETARRIDEEVKRLLDDALKNVTQILTSRREALFAVAERLKVIEAINGEELRQIIEANSRGPQVVPGTGDAPKRVGRGETPEPSGESQASL